jgi:ABC-2 type transport system permease protein
MSKIRIIFQREYITRVRNKTFLLSTFLFPAILILFFLGSAYLSAKSISQTKIAVKDESGMYENKLISSPTVEISYPEKVSISNYRSLGYDAILMIYGNENKADSVRLYSEKQTGLSVDEAITSQINRIDEDKMLQLKGVSTTMLDSVRKATEKQKVNYRSFKQSGAELKEDNKALSYGIAFGSGLLIYITLFVYGAAVMRGVMEEKTNRIAEVIVSSVRPFQLMMGKITGIAAVGLTQLLLWIILIILLSTAASFFLSPDNIPDPSTMGGISSMNQQNEMAIKMLNVKTNIMQANWGLIIGSFLFYFLGGYLFYASLFAAIGSVVNEDPQEAQSLMLPVTMPIIFAFIIMTAAIENPTGPMAVWGSIIPFTSPIVMMARIPAGIPETVSYWELGLSMFLLIGGFIFTTWMSGRIYRTGILMYGKKPNWKTMLKWVFGMRS